MKSDEDEDEFFSVSETEPLPLSQTATLVSELPQSPLKHPQTEPASLEHPPVERISPVLPPVHSKISPIIMKPKPPIIAPKPKIATVVAPATAGAPSKLLDVSSIVSKVKPTVPFKPMRTSLSPKDAFPPKGRVYFCCILVRVNLKLEIENCK